MIEVTQLVAKARAAQRIADGYDQARVDDLVAAAGWAILEPARNRALAELAVRIGLAWREMRRGASAAGLRDWMYRTDTEDGVEQGQMDSLDLLASQPSWRMSELADALRVTLDRQTWFELLTLAQGHEVA